MTIMISASPAASIAPAAVDPAAIELPPTQPIDITELLDRLR